jgi:hypothetical protein
MRTLRLLISWCLVALVLLNGVFPSKLAQAATISSKESLLISSLYFDSDNFKRLEFSDTDEFYDTLYKALKSDEAIEIVTNYTRYSQFPQRLKSIFKMDSHSPLYSMASSICPEGVDCIPVSMQSESGWLNYNALVPICILGFTAAGVGVGYYGLGGDADPFAPVAGFFGAVVGGGLGIAACNVTAAVAGGKHEVTFHLTRLMTIQVKPANL